MLCDVLHDAEAPIVFTGAIRPASAPGADGPANLVDAVSVAASEAAAGMGVLRLLRRRDPPRALRAQDRHDLAGRLLLAADRPARPRHRGPPDDLVADARATRRSTRPHLDSRVLIVPTASGDDGTLARAALTTEPDGVVIGTLGAGHLNPDLLELWARRRRADPGGRLLPPRARRDPQRDLRLPRAPSRTCAATGIIPAGFLSPQAARMKLLACLASGLSIDEIRWAFRQDDG